jgi:hypothetical protein
MNAEHSTRAAKHPRTQLARLTLALMLLVAACRSEHATKQACRAIVHRIVDLELRERGFRDHVLAQRKRNEIEHLFAPEIEQCTGKRLGRDALTCVELATNAEQISHQCLR